MEKNELMNANQQVSQKHLNKNNDLNKTTDVKSEQKVIIDIKNFTKKFGKFVACKNVNFQIKSGSIHGFIGPNGSGKTTTIKSIIGAYTIKKGMINIMGFKPGSEKANRLIGYIPEKASFPSHLSALDYIAEMATFNGFKIKDAKVKALQILKDLKLEHHKNRNPNSFSSGMKKKIMLAQSLMNDPEILILDEPAANLDPTARKELFDTFIELRNRGITIFISSHVLSELERIVDDITFIFYGKILFSGNVSNLSTKNNNLYLKTSDNQLFKAYFEKRMNLKVSGDLNSEIIIENVDEIKKKQILSVILNSSYSIASFRHNDLQSFYDKLVNNYYENNKEETC